jgi:hypothetical protein
VDKVTSNLFGDEGYNLLFESVCVAVMELMSFIQQQESKNMLKGIEREE